MITASDISTIIKSGNFELVDMLHRIDILYADGNFTDEERTSLIDEARSVAKPDMSQGEIGARVSALEYAVDMLTKRVDALNGSEVDPGTVADYVQGTRYYKGDRVRFDGKVYEAIEGDAGHPIVWSPADYPQGWKLIE